MGDIAVETVRGGDPGPWDEVGAVLAAAGEDGEPALAEQKRLEIEHRPEDPFVGFFVRAGDDLVGYGHLSPGTGVWGLEVALVPGSRQLAREARRLVVARALEAVARAGGGRLQHWVARAGPDDDAEARRAGFTVERRLLQLRADLPVLPERRGHPPELTLRPFRPGDDDAEWLEVNNRAFAGHPEQGAWTLTQLHERQREPWFEPEGFLVLSEDGHLVGSCWTKVHAEMEPPAGEIYVISVDPARHRGGLGRALTLAGLDWMVAHGLRQALLYVDEANGPALSLYRALGFTLWRTDAAYLRVVDPAGAEGPRT
jgi:mycothiol synthase